MPFKEMLKWAVAKEDNKQSPSQQPHQFSAIAFNTATKSLKSAIKKKRSQQRVNNYCLLKEVEVTENTAKNTKESQDTLEKARKLLKKDVGAPVNCGLLLWEPRRLRKTVKWEGDTRTSESHISQGANQKHDDKSNTKSTDYLLGLSRKMELITNNLLDDHIPHPQLLETPICNPAVFRSAKKVTLNRREIQKLTHLHSQSKKLTRFLKKYYHDFLPTQPEDEEAACNLEEKSVTSYIIQGEQQPTKKIDKGIRSTLLLVTDCHSF